MSRLIHKTIGDCVTLRADLTPKANGIHCRDISLTWREVDEISDFLAVEYAETGISKGTHVAIWSVNSSNWVLCFYALQKLGAVVIPVNTCYKEQELENLLRHMDVQYLMYGNGLREFSYLEILKAIDFSKLPEFIEMFPLEAEGTLLMRHVFPKQMSVKKAAYLQRLRDLATPLDTACILPTSGTTSTPKGVMLSHNSLVNNALEISRQMHWDASDRLCIAVPLFHCFGITTGVLAALHTGSELQILKYYKTLDVFEQVEHDKSTVLNGVPTMFLAMEKNEKRGMFDLSSLKSGIIAGSPITREEYRRICRFLKLDKLQVSYGQTESSPCISISDYEDGFEQKASSAGKVIPEIEVKILVEAGDTKEGEILTKGYHVMQGYYKKEEETKAAIDVEGWLHTGDIGRLSEDGYLTISGRMKDMIIRGGENIAPLEIEECIELLKAVRSVKVLGIQADVLQEEIVACIIWNEGMELSRESVQAHVKKYLANYKVPRYVLAFSEFPLSENGKIMTGMLQKLAEKKLAINN